MIKRTIKLISISSLLLLVFSCNDIKNISAQMETIKGNQEILISKQKEFDQKISFLQTSIKNLNLASNKTQQKTDPKKQQKRKNPNPNFVHNIDIGESVVLGNPDAKVTITKFTDFQ